MFLGDEEWEQPELWNSGEMLSPLGDDWPFTWDMTDGQREILDELHQNTVCRRENCQYDDPVMLAQSVVTAVTRAVELVIVAATTMYRHGDELAAEQLLLALNFMGEDLVMPYVRSKGLDTD